MSIEPENPVSKDQPGRYGRDWLRHLPPRWVFRLLSWFGFKPPPMKAIMDAGSFLLPQWMYVAAKLQLPELLSIEGKTASELGQLTNVDPDRIGRLLYALEQRGYFRRSAVDACDPLNGPWINTATSATLMANHPNTIRPILLHWVEDCYRPGGELLESMQQNTCAFTLEHAPKHTSFFSDFLPAHPDKATQFSDAMTASSAFSDEAVCRDFDWSRFTKIVDLGGSNGSFLEKALHRYPNVRGLLFDLPNVIEEARVEWSKKDGAASARLEFSSGDFFEADTVPTVGSGEVAVLRNVLHDWPEEDCVRILSNVRQTMASGGRLVLVEVGLATNGRGHVLEQARSSLDMLMMTMFEGKERTRAELTKIVELAGYELVKIAETRSIFQVLEAKPAV